MKAVLGIVLGLIAGFLLGGIAPRRQSAELAQQVVELEGKVEKAERSSGVRYLPLPFMEAWLEAQGSSESDTGPPSQSASPESAVLRGQPGSGGADSPGVQRERRSFWPWRDRRSRRDRDGEGDGRRARTPAERLERFENAVQAQKLRASQSRAALVEQGNLTPEQVARLDGVILELNAGLEKHAEQVTDVIEAETMPPPLETLFVGRELTNLLYEGQTDLEEIVRNGDTSGIDPEALQIWNYVDLEAFRPAVAALGQAPDLDGAPASGADDEP